MSPRKTLESEVAWGKVTIDRWLQDPSGNTTKCVDPLKRVQFESNISHVHESLLACLNFVISRLLFTAHWVITRAKLACESGKCWWHSYKSSIHEWFELTICFSDSELLEPCCVGCFHRHPPAPAHASDAGCHPSHSSAHATAVDTRMIPTFLLPWARSWISAPSADCCHCCQALEMTQTKIQTQEEESSVKIVSRGLKKKIFYRNSIEISIFHDMT